VDDDPILRRLYKRSLEKLGLEAVVVADGAGAREAVRDLSFDLVLMDQHLTRERGADLARELRVEAPAELRWVCISGSIGGGPGGPDESLTVFDGCAQKPATVEEMRKLLSEWLPRGPSVD